MQTKLIKNEIKRAFFSNSFFISIGIGLFISLWHFGWHVLPLSKELPKMADVTPYSLYGRWIGANFFGLPQYLYFLILANCKMKLQLLKKT